MGERCAVLDPKPIPGSLEVPVVEETNMEDTENRQNKHAYSGEMKEGKTIL